MVKHDAPAVLPLAEFATIEDVLGGLRERGGRATHARRLLLTALFRDRTHRSAEELAEEIQTQAPAVNISTIYRNLDELVRLGVVDRSHLGSGPAAYHLASTTHGHLVCEHCGAMTEVPSELFRDIAQTLASRYGFAADPHRLSVIGRCADCQQHQPAQLRHPLTAAPARMGGCVNCSSSAWVPGIRTRSPSRRCRPSTGWMSSSASTRATRSPG